jgi:hypothetical protein
LLPRGLVPPCLQQLLWLQEAHTTTQVDPKTSAALWAPDNSSLPALLPHRTLSLLLSASSPLPHMQMIPRLHALLLCWCYVASLPTEHRGPALTTKLSCRRAPAAPSKSGNPALSLSGNLSFCGCQETYFAKAQKGPVLPTVTDHRRVPTSLLKTKNARFPTTGKESCNILLSEWHQKACLLRCIEAQSSPLCLQDSRKNKPF